MNTTKPYQLDPNGFPAITCTRCGGRGTIPQYSKVFQGVCFDCDGFRLTYPTKAIARAAHAARRQLGGVNDPNAELLAQVADTAAKARDSYDKTLARRQARTGSQLDAATRRLVDAVRATLNNNDLDDIGKAVEICRIRDRRHTTTAARRVRDHIESIQMGWDEHTGTTLPQRLNLIAAYIDTLTA